MRRDPFQAIADPTRREIIRIISQEPLNLNAIADKFSISRPAISKQIRILHECGLIIIKQEGRERYCQANLQPLSEVSRWIEQYHAFWTGKLDALETFLTVNSSPSKRTVKKSPANRHSTAKKNKRK